MTIEKLGAPMIDLVPELAAFVPPAKVFDKHVSSPWIGTDLNELLRGASVDTIVISGGETDVCVQATVMGAIERQRLRLRSKKSDLTSSRREWASSRWELRDQQTTDLQSMSEDVAYARCRCRSAHHRVFLDAFNLTTSHGARKWG